MVKYVSLDPLNMFKQEKNVFPEEDKWILITALNDYNLNWLQKSTFSVLKSSAYLTEL